MTAELTTPQTTTAWRRPRITFHPLLFAAYPVLFLWSQNLGETSAADVLPLMVIAVAIAAALTLVLGLVLRDVRRAALVVTPAAVGILMYGHVETLIEPLGIRTTLQQLAWVALVGLALVAALRLREPALARVSRILDRVGALLVVVALVVIVPAEVSAATTRQVEASPPTVPGVAERPLRDVYYLVLDRYGSDRSLSLWLGVDNDLTPWLTDRDFRVLPDSAANYVKTALSMASTLNMTHLDELAARMGPDSDDHAPVFSMLQDSAVVRQFKALGYTYHHIGSWFGPTKTDSAADRNLFVGGPSDFGAALYDSSAIPAILKRLRIRTTVGTYERAYATNRFGWDAVRSVRDEPGPKLVVAHFLLPHPPYVFAADGTYMDEEAGKRLTERQRFEAQLAWTNAKIREMVEDLQALPEDRRPIIILQADEGPYPAPYQNNTVTYDWSTATPEQLWQKFGILNAWYIPDGVDPGLYDTMTSVNTFPTLFSGYFGLPTPRLEDRSYTSASKVRPYDLDDITDRLSSGR